MMKGSNRLAVICFILTLTVFSIIGCSATNGMPDEAIESLEKYLVDGINYREDFENFSYRIVSKQKGPHPNNYRPRAEEIWCVTVSHNLPDRNFVANSFIVYREGLLWETTEGENSFFLRIGCTNYQERNYYR